MARPNPDVQLASPLHPGFINAGATLLIAAFVSDVMYCRTSIWQWANFSAWLISAGLVMALVATIVLVIDFVIGRARRIDWLSFAVVAAAALLSLVNVFIHSRDTWTSVFPGGVAISIAVTLLLLVAAVRGWRVTAASTAPTGDRA